MRSIALIAALMGGFFMSAAEAQTPKVPSNVVPSICSGATTTNAAVCIHDGTQQVPIGTLNPKTHQFAPSMPDASLGGSKLATGAASQNLGFTPLRPSSNLSDIGSASTARSNLGLGGVATLNIGSTSRTVGDGGVLASVQSIANGAANGTSAFLATGGSLARTTAARAADVVNILDQIGSDRTGTSDSGSALQAASAYAASNYKAISFPPGTYLFKSYPRGLSSKNQLY